jgi:hypothetical protein
MNTQLMNTQLMNTQEQAYINGFVKRASAYGFNEQEAIHILKQAVFPSQMMPNSPGGVAGSTAAPTMPSLQGMGESVGKYLGGALGGLSGVAGYNTSTGDINRGGLTSPTSIMQSAGHGAGIGEQFGRRAGQAISDFGGNVAQKLMSGANAIASLPGKAMGAVKSYGQGLMNDFSKARSQSYVAPSPGGNSNAPAAPAGGPGGSGGSYTIKPMQPAPAPGASNFVGPTQPAPAPGASNFVGPTQPAPAPGASNFVGPTQPAAGAQPAAGGAGPSNQFINKVLGGYTPGSKGDEKMKGVVTQLYNEGMTNPSQIYADPRYRQARGR